eukprot:NODE_2130_length_1131_cov_341.745020_g2112_i0.p1 GENE.NODE_2130_length_1131_cov_341.745020_g2112_i0~~NODE_2130_length_1131_cov_341.745020_g2112_i0.p1  ORF type:complete len:326 (+),score=91.49 NODE_2130_length_1131_cov_341.745020_g2112_i0:79-1056(+)
MLSAITIALVIGAAVGRTQFEEGRLWADYKDTYGKAYGVAEEAARFSCFQKNLQLIDERNARDSAVHGVNQFADMCEDEFALTHFGVKGAMNRTAGAPMFSAEAAKKAASGSVDWRSKGAVCPIKNQGMCGSCWSFSATGAMEGACEIKTGKLDCLSEQELVSCSGKDGNQGCNGGLMDNAFKWVVGNGGIDSESDYPYTSGSGQTGTCKTEKLANKVCKISSWKDLPKDETQIAATCESSGPIAVAVDAQSGWQTYMGGIMKTCTGTSLDHGVLIVGYGTEGSTPYWIVKNSWGASWGESGYIRLERGTNQCGIDMAASIPIAA